VAKYLKSQNGASFDKISQLTKANRMQITNTDEQMKKLLGKFFSLLSKRIDKKGSQL
jgi:hypothetical protein